jgi:2-succinyl-5-enolpyruvyl-6-hydroxy-3-cyclohexene-1-carboxylate synthase
LTKEGIPVDLGALRYRVLERPVWLINTGELSESVMASVREKLVRRLMVNAHAAAQDVGRLDPWPGTFFIANSLRRREVPDLCIGLRNAII